MECLIKISEIGKELKMNSRVNQFSFIVAAFVAAVGCATMDAGEGSLIDAAGNSQTGKVKALLAAGAEVDAKNNHGITALMAASYGGHTEEVKALLSAGADVNAKDNFNSTALIYAAANGQARTAELLIAAGADVEAKKKIWR